MKDYIFAININKTGEAGIINVKTMKVLCLCPKENAEIILKALGREDCEHEAENGVDYWRCKKCGEILN